jgi:hypothetical protein
MRAGSGFRAIDADGSEAESGATTAAEEDAAPFRRVDESLFLRRSVFDPSSPSAVAGLVSPARCPLADGADEDSVRGVAAAEIEFFDDDVGLAC